VSRRERETRVPLDGLTEEQLAILREDADDFLIARAEDLRLLRDDEDPGRAIGEVAALGRLGFALRQGEILVPDRTLRRLVARRTTETIHLEEVKGEYERELSRHEAWLALLGHLPKGRGDA
jgi:hypothetical protein